MHRQVEKPNLAGVESGSGALLSTSIDCRWRHTRSISKRPYLDVDPGGLAAKKCRLLSDPLTTASSWPLHGQGRRIIYLSHPSAKRVKNRFLQIQVTCGATLFREILVANSTHARFLPRLLIAKGSGCNLRARCKAGPCMACHTLCTQPRRSGEKGGHQGAEVESVPPRTLTSSCK